MILVPGRVLVYWLCTPFRAIRFRFRAIHRRLQNSQSLARALRRELYDRIATLASGRIAHDQQTERKDERDEFARRCDALMQMLKLGGYGLQLTDVDDIRAVEWGKTHEYPFAGGYVGGAYIVNITTRVPRATKWI